MHYVAAIRAVAARYGCHRCAYVVTPILPSLHTLRRYEGWQYYEATLRVITQIRHDGWRIDGLPLRAIVVARPLRRPHTLPLRRYVVG